MVSLLWSNISEENVEMRDISFIHYCACEYDTPLSCLNY